MDEGCFKIKFMDNNGLNFYEVKEDKGEISLKE